MGVNIQDCRIEIPQVLYHATPSENYDTIISDGLELEYAGSNWGEDFSKNYIYMASSAGLAEQMAENASGGYAACIVFEVDISQLDLSKLETDDNCYVDEEELEENGSWQYRDNILAEALACLD